MSVSRSIQPSEASAAVPVRDRSFALLLLCFFLSGLAALIYETAWTREFAFVFGTSELAVATVLAAYMGGLTAGAALAGRFISRVTRPVLAYGLLELGIAAAALAVPVGIALSRALYVALFGGRAELSDAGGLATSLFYLVCSFAILFVPTAMMGATLPLLARYAVHEQREIGGRVGLLYAVNTAGAVSGVLASAFVLLPAVGLRATIAAAAAVNALVFAAAWALERSSPRALASTPRAPDRAPGLDRARWILPLIAASGFASFSYEVLWVRLVGHLVGSGTHAFATMLASFLLGIAIGAAVASRLARSRRIAALGFAAAQLGTALLSIAAFAAVNQIPAFDDVLRERGVARIWADTLACMLTLFPAALCIGATFPFAVRVHAHGADDAGAASARVYASNTLGSIAGSVCAAFLLVPGLGYAGTLALCAAINLAIALAVALLSAPRRRVVAALALAGAAWLVVRPPATPWGMLRATSMGLGARAWGRVTHFGVGRSSTVLLTEQRLGWSLRNNGLPEAGIPRPGTWQVKSALTRWLTALPVLARPDARSLLLVGLGGGMALETVPRSVERIDVVELEAEVLEANRRVASQRWRDPLADPRVHVHLNDARNALLLASGRFDVIVSQPSHPWAGGAAHLYTREFFELAASRLTPAGVFVQWIGLPFVDEPLFRSLLATLSAVFPHVRAYAPPPGDSVLFLASGEPLDVENAAARAIAANPADFGLLGITVREDVVASLLLDEAGVRALGANAAINRDGHNRLQSRSASLGAASLSGRIDEITGTHDPLARLPEGIDAFYVLRLLDPPRAHRVAESLRDPIDREIGHAIAEMSEGRSSSARRRLEDALAKAPRHTYGRAAWLRLSAGAIAAQRDPELVVAPPLDAAERAIARAWLARQRDPSGAELLALDESLAAIPLQHPLGGEAARLRVQARLRRADSRSVQDAIGIVEASLGDRPEPSSILLRAEAYAAAREHAAVLETIEALVTEWDVRLPATRAHARRARELVAAVPLDDRGLVPVRQRLLRLLGGG